MKKTLLLGLAMMSLVPASAQHVTKINDHTAQVRLDNGQYLYLDFYGQNIFRLFQDPKGGEMRDPVAIPAARILVDQPRRPGSITVADNTIQTNSLRVTVAEDGSLSVLHKKGLIPMKSAARDKSSDVRMLHIGAADFQKGKTLLTLNRESGDHFYGGGCQNGRFSHGGKSIAIENTNSWVDGGVASPAPFYWSTAGYGVMGYTFAPGRYDFGAADAEKTTLMHETDYLDYFFMFSPEPTDLLRDYYQLTGNPVLLPKFGFYQGHLNAYNRDFWTPAEAGKTGFMAYEDGLSYNESQKDNGGIRESLNGELKGAGGEGTNYQFSARAAIDRYLDNDFPLGWFLPNDGYGAGYGQTSTLDGNIQNLKDFGDYARSRGVEIGLWTQSDLHPKEGIEALLQRDIVKEVRDAGVRVLKTDVAWMGAGYSFGLNGVADVAQVMPYYGSEARPFIITLDGWAGTQRYAGIWTGDQTGGEWEYIRFHIPTYIGCGLSGQPNVSSDMDGIFGGNNVPVNVRDFQWKTFTPMQLNMDGWGSNPKYPQALGEPAASINRWYLKLKSRLMPYTYTIAHEAVTGKPMMRAMFLEEDRPSDFLLGQATQYQFMYGPSILVAPIYKPTRPTEGQGVADGDDERDGIYLPEGEWVDFFNGDVYKGGRLLNDYKCPLWKMPIFVKRGAIIPTHKSTNTPAETDQHLRQYDLYPAPGTQAFEEYDDDGRTTSQRCVVTQVSQRLDEKGRYTISVLPAQGDYEGFQPSKATRLSIYCSAEPRKLSLKLWGKKVALTKAASYADCQATPGSFFFGKSDLEHMDIPVLMVNVPETMVGGTGACLHGSKECIRLEAEGITVDTANRQLCQHGALQAPKASLEGKEAYTLTPQWQPVDGADYYEISFQDQLYSTIGQTQYTIEGLTPETAYTMKLRAVNADGQSAWTDLAATTTADPLQHAIRGAKGQTTCDNQGGQGIGHLFDFDETSTWHTSWKNDPQAVPFDIIVDLRSVNHLDKLQYVPRPDSGNGTLLEGSIELSMDRQHWSAHVPFSWAKDGSVKEVNLKDIATAQTAAGQASTDAALSAVRYLRLHVTKAVGNFGSGQQLYIFRQPGSDHYIPGDINKDGRIDDNDLTSFLNYTGLRRGDGDFDYISLGDLNQNGLIDVYDISAVAIELETGVSSRRVPNVEGSVTMQVDKLNHNAGDELRLTVTGRGLRSVNGISFCLPYDPAQYEYLGVETAPDKFQGAEGDGIPQMYNMTYDRLHTNGQKALYPTFVNLGEQPYAEGDKVLFVIKLRAKQKGKFNLRHTDGMLVDKYQNVVTF